MSGFTSEPIAIVGSSCRFPGGASSPSKLWDLLREPRDIVQEIPPSRFNTKGFYHEDGEHHGCTNVKHAYLMEEDPRVFDCAFFGISPKEAEAMDPQQRMLLETVYEGIESAGYSMQQLRGSATAVFVGVMNSDYMHLLFGDPDNMPLYTAPGTAMSIMANRVSYFFDWTGPSSVIDTACSSSMVALHHAVQALRGGEANMAVVAGANLILGPQMFISLSKLHMLSPTGGSRMWDASVDGYTRGEGLASVILKPLNQAIADGDHIDCIIRETGVNQDGRTPGLTVPSAEAQASLIKATYTKSGLDLSKPADRPQYFESHGTGTPAGDPIEAEAIHRALFPQVDDHGDHERLPVGSIKTVIGHLEGAAGLAGVLKASLALQHNTVPPNLHFKELNPRIRPFYGNLHVPTAATSWPTLCPGAPRRVSVNSFGFGGTNGHAILESWEPANHNEALSQIKLNGTTHHQGDEVIYAGCPFVLSANSSQSLGSMAKRLGHYLAQHPDTNLNDLAHTLCRRSEFAFRASFYAANTGQLAQKLQNAATSGTLVSRSRTQTLPEAPRILGIFTGQGAQWPAMGSELYSASTLFHESIAELQRSLDKLPDGPDWTLAGELLAAPETSRVHQAAVSQPLCTAIQIAMVDMLRAAGVSFSAVVGHSSGEIGAAYAAGFVNARDAIRIAFYRGIHAALAKGPDGQRGKMLAVGMGIDQASAFCDEFFSGRISVAASNSQQSCTLAGDADAIHRAKDQLDKQRISTRLLQVDTAYHSHHMQPCAEPYLESLRRCNIAAQDGSRTCVMYSSVFGSNTCNASLRDGSPLTGQYWVDNMTEPVLFSQAVQKAIADEQYHFVLEVGPHPSLKGPCSAIIKAQTGTLLPYSGVMKRGETALDSFSGALGLLWESFSCPSPQMSFEGIRKLFIQPQDQGSSSPVLLREVPSYPWDHDKVLWKESSKSKAHRAWNQPIHELLGRAITLGEQESREMHWRQVFKLGEMPWLRGHMFQGEVLFPATGYIAMAYEAALQLVQGKQHLRLVELHNLDIARAITVPDNSPGIEVAFNIRITHHSSTSVDANFACYSGPVDAVVEDVDSEVLHTSTKLNCTGRVHFIFGEPSRCIDTLPARVEPQLPMETLDMDKVYGIFSQLGLDYSGDFRSEAVRRRLHQTAVNIRQPQTLQSIHIHPGSLDAALTGLLTAFSYPGDGRLWAPYLPRHIDCVRINVNDDTMRSHSETIADCFVTRGDAKAVIGDFDVFSAVGGQAQIQARGVVFNSFEQSPVGPGIEQDGRRQLNSCHQWVRDAAWGLEPSDRMVLSDDRKALSIFIDRSAYFYLQKLREIDSEELALMSWNHRHLVKWATQHLIPQVEAGHHPSIRPEWAYDTAEMLEGWHQMYPGQIDLQFIRAVGENILGILRGTVPALQVMMQESMLDRVYTEGLGCREANQECAALVGQLAHQNPHMKVLEIGAGTGGATRGILKALEGRFTSYMYTDISPGFFDKARDIFKAYSSRLIFKTLNIEKEPSIQGFNSAGYDLIIASNVLHATQKLDNTMRNCRKLLRPGGRLVLLEITGDYMMAQLTMGTLPGWFLGIDDGRIWKPTISVEQWDGVLKVTGFSGVDTVTTSFFSVMMTQAVDDAVRVMREPLSAPVDALPCVNDELCIIGQDFPLLLELLGPRFGRITMFASLNEMSEMRRKGGAKISIGATVLMLSDLGTPTFQDMKKESFEVLQETVRNAATILWVTQGALDGGDPFASMAVAWGRSIRAEHSSIKLQFLDLDSAKAPDLTLIATMLLRLILANGPNSYEPEISVAGDGAVYLPRITPAEVLNQRLDTAAETDTHKASLSDVDRQIELISLNGTFEFLESQTAAGNTPSQDSSVQVQVLASSARSFLISDGRKIFLCIGLDLKSGNKVLALSGTNASILTVAEESVLNWPGGISKDLDCSQPQQLLAFVLAESILRGLAGRIWIHGADEHVRKPAEQTAHQRPDLSVFFTTSDLTGASLSEDVVYIHPYITRRHLKMVQPADIQAFVNLDQPGNEALHDLMLTTLPCSVHTRSGLSVDGNYSKNLNLSCDFTVVKNLIQQHLDNIRSSPPGTPPSHTNDTSQVIGINQISGVVANTLSPVTVIDWRDDTPVKVKRRPLDHHSLFSANKTYLLVGLTGDLGQSVCEWMVDHGARHIAMTSRNPRVPPEVVDHLCRKGAKLRIVALDVSDYDALQAIYQDIKCTMPPVGGVMNAAMVLHDRLFVNMAWDDFAMVLKPKVQGSQNLDRLFHQQDSSLDFFILFSSLSCIVGNPGQAAYAAANNFMTGLVEQRRRRGLAASVVHIAIMKGLGYVHRASDDIEAALHPKFMTLAETDLHNLLAEAMVRGQPRPSQSGEIITGLKRGTDSFWQNNPRLWHYLIEQDERSSAGGGEGRQVRRGRQSVAKLLDAADDENTARTVLEDCFAEMLGNMLQMQPEQLDRGAPVASFGVDSLVAVQIRTWFLKQVGVEVPVLKVMGDGSLMQLCTDVLGKRRSKRQKSKTLK